MEVDRNKQTLQNNKSSLGNDGALSGMGAAQLSNTVDDAGKDSDCLNSSPTKVTPGNSAMNKEGKLHDNNDGLTPSKSTTNPKKESIRDISERFANMVYGFLLGKRVAYPVVTNYVRNTWGKYTLNPNVNILQEDVGNVLVWVKLHGVYVTAFSEDGLSAITTKLDLIISITYKIIGNKGRRIDEDEEEF
nr:zinc knuckle CX2CX4HX4C [Tanacetum cinerariifolium]